MSYKAIPIAEEFSPNYPLIKGSSYPYSPPAVRRSNDIGSSSRATSKLTRIVIAISFFATAAVTLALLIIKANSCDISLPWKPSEPKKLKRNVIFMVSDGFGPASETFAREYYQYVVNGADGKLPEWDDDSYPKQLPLDTILVGQSRTRSASSWITDSAAGATAFSCGLKSFNAAIAVNSSSIPCTTVLEAAKNHGYMTAQVVLSRITHATPASFNAHSTHRDFEDLIALHQMGETPFGRVTDLMFGGGRCFFLPQHHADGSCRKDDRDLWKEAKTKFGFKTLIKSRDEFDKLSVSKDQLPMMGLFASDHMSYDIDRDPSVEPSLAEMTSRALEIMTESTKDSEKGFFMLVEGSRIDMAAHENDAGTHAREILAYQETISLVKKYVDANPGTVMISVSDHETGGLALGRQLGPEYPKYEWNPEPVYRQKNSTAVMASMIKKSSNQGRSTFIENVIFKDILGITDYTAEDVEYLSNTGRSSLELMSYLADMVSRRALLAWAGHGHSGVDVNLYAYAGNNAHSVLVDPLRRNLENVELGTFMKEYMQLPNSLFEKMNGELKKALDDGSLKISKKSVKGLEALVEEGERVFEDYYFH